MSREIPTQIFSVRPLVDTDYNTPLENDSPSKSEQNGHLCPELVDMIIDFLHDDQITLRSRLNVASSWLPSVRLHLYKRIIIRGDRTEEIAGNLDRFIALLRGSLPAACSIREVGIITGKPEDEVEISSKLAVVGIYQLQSLLRLLPSLKVLFLRSLIISGNMAYELQRRARFKSNSYSKTISTDPEGSLYSLILDRIQMATASPTTFSGHGFIAFLIYIITQFPTIQHLELTPTSTQPIRTPIAESNDQYLQQLSQLLSYFSNTVKARFRPISVTLSQHSISLLELLVAMGVLSSVKTLNLRGMEDQESHFGYVQTRCWG
ncbi:hypothetical protein ABKN59_010185 [Abortiporus biennis]